MTNDHRGLSLGLFTLALAALAVLAAEPEVPAVPEIREREIYVPYDELLKVAGKHPQATVITLEEYRNLVELATARRFMKKDVVLPPVQAVLSEVVYEGEARESTARFQATFKVSVTSDKWVSCELGLTLGGLGEITLDNRPAPVVSDQGKLYLLVKGAGLHTGTLRLSLPLTREEDVVRLAGYLLSAASSVVRLTVPGQVTALGEAGPLVTERLSAGQAGDAALDRTRFVLALGRLNQVDLKWKGRREGEKNPALFLARQEISYLLERASPGFVWHARVTIARRKADRLVFREPPGSRVVRLSGRATFSNTVIESKSALFWNM